MINVYANALIDLSISENLLDVFYNHFLIIDDLYKNLDIQEFINNKFVDKEYKKEMIVKHFKDFSEYFVNFLFILANNDHLDKLGDISNKYKELYYREKNIEYGFIYGTSLTNNDLEKVEKALANKLNKQIKLEFIKDETLISGYKIKVGSKLYDNSYKHKLEMIKKSLKEGA